MVRVKPRNPPSQSRVCLHGIDHAPQILLPVNLLFKPSNAGPAQLHDFANSLQDVIDKLPMIAGSICSVRDVQGVESKMLIDTGRGVDLIWADSPIAYADLPGFADIVARPNIVNFDDPDQVLLMVKFTKFACGTLAMGISFSHLLVDCTSFVDILKEWARVSRGGPISDALAITSWERHPEKYFPPPTPGAIPYGMHMPTGSAMPSGRPRTTILSGFFFTWQSLLELKNSCAPTSAGSSAWVSTGDCVGAVLWRALTVARQALLKPGRNVNMYMAVDGRDRSKAQPDALQYFGNLVTPITVTLSQSALLFGSLASVALAIRRAICEQATDINIANMLALFDLVKAYPTTFDTNLGDSSISNWTKYPLVGEALDFGGGAPFWGTTGPLPDGQIVILPQKDGYLGIVMVEMDWVNMIQANDELLKYAKPIRV